MAIASRTPAATIEHRSRRRLARKAARRSGTPRYSTAMADDAACRSSGRRPSLERRAVRASRRQVACAAGLHGRRRPARRRRSQRRGVGRGGARLGDRLDRGRRPARPRSCSSSIGSCRGRWRSSSSSSRSPAIGVGGPLAVRGRTPGSGRLPRRARSGDRRRRSRNATIGSVTSPARSASSIGSTELTERLQDQLGTPSRRPPSTRRWRCRRTWWLHPDDLLPASSDREMVSGGTRAAPATIDASGSTSGIIRGAARATQLQVGAAIVLAPQWSASTIWVVGELLDVPSPGLFALARCGRVGGAVRRASSSAWLPVIIVGLGVAPAWQVVGIVALVAIGHAVPRGDALATVRRRAIAVRRARALVDHRRRARLRHLRLRAGWSCWSSSL